MRKNETPWVTPTPSQKVDLLDQAIFGIGDVHGNAKRRGVMMSERIYDDIRREYFQARRISQELTPCQRLIVCDILRFRNSELSLLAILATVSSTKK